MKHRSDNIDAIDITALRQLLTQRRGAVWVSLDGRALGSTRGQLYTHANRFARPIDEHSWSH